MINPRSTSLAIGSVREVNVESGLRATASIERLELHDYEEHILGIKIVGDDHRLRVLTLFFSSRLVKVSFLLLVLLYNTSVLIVTMYEECACGIT